MSGSSRGRGRPKGPSGKLMASDLPILVRAADLIAEQPMRPTTAMRRALPGIGDSHLRRLQVRWKEMGNLLLAEAAGRRAARDRVRAEGWPIAGDPWPAGQAAMRAMGVMSPRLNDAAFKALVGIGKLPDMASAIGVLPDAAFRRQLGMIPDIGKIVGFAHLDLLGKLNPDNPLSKIFGTLDALNAIPTARLIDSVMGRPAKKN